MWYDEKKWHMSKIFILKGEDDGNKTRSKLTFDMMQCFLLPTSENERIPMTELVSGWTDFFVSRSFNYHFRTEARQSNL